MRLLLACCCALVAGGCATTGSPVGGAKDTQGPVLQVVQPPSGTTNYRGQPLELTFDEFLNPGIVGSEAVFVSPVPTKPPRVTVLGKRLQVRWQAPLDDSTTYVVSLGSAVKDNNANNPLAQPVVLALATGPVADSLEVYGQVYHPYEGRGQQGWLVGLYLADSLKHPTDFYLRRPRYLAQTDSQGRYRMRYLAPGRYYALAFKDRDADFSYNQPNEAVGLDYDSLLTLSPDQRLTVRDFSASLPDSVAPRLRSVQRPTPWEVRLELSEGLWQGTYQWQYPDSAAAQPLVAAAGHFPQVGRRVLRLPVPSPTDSLVLRLHVTDSLANSRDTLVQIKARPGEAPKTLGLEVLKDPDPLNPYHYELVANDALHPDSLRRYLTVQDTAAMPVPHTLVVNTFKVVLELPPTLSTENQYFVTLDTLFASVHGLRLERRGSTQLAYPEPDNFGQLTGALSAEGTQPVVVQLIDLKTQIRYILRPDFTLKHVPPGSYQVAAWADAVPDGHWTAGALVPRRLPEVVWFYEEPITVRAGWVQEFEAPFPPERSQRLLKPPAEKKKATAPPR